ncbi:hypothetical protein M422DRAFT_29148 [Sphaerobolus stellatus SS14]|uniref:Uncharacterized protein n=1 Tax=Sphaerobolus stellatus (strain SS14) TaxID=990650 RepID=A0A0C9W3J1_SPHS4|nr:hypothetical protein M422DRAFT_29148 [Sphaerobolus stellatus SS14]
MSTDVERFRKWSDAVPNEDYNPQPEDVQWMKQVTGIQDEEELKNHALKIQAEGLVVYPYPCIKKFAFTTSRVGRHPAYQDVLAIGKNRPGAIYLEAACCFGNDVRKVVSDGYPIENVIATDLKGDFWTVGQKFFRTTPETFPVPFLLGDAFDASFISPDTPPAPTSSTPPIRDIPSLKTLTSLTPLQHHVSIIHAAAFFHLFNEEPQRRLAFLLGSLLSPSPGSMIIGSHGGAPDTEENKKGATRFIGVSESVFTHSPTSWRSLWIGEGGVFKEGDVKVWAEAKVLPRPPSQPTLTDSSGLPVERCVMTWSVIRI